MENETLFLYTVNPRKIITGLSGGVPVRTSKSLFLTKEDVKICLQKASVYRRFSLEGINERVNVGNIDRLHRENYVSEEDWEKVIAKEMSEGHGKVNNVEPISKEINESKQVEDPEVEVKEDIVLSDDEESVLKEAVPVEEENIVEDYFVEDTGVEDTLDRVSSEDEVQTETDNDEEKSDETAESKNQRDINQRIKYNAKNKR